MHSYQSCLCLNQLQTRLTNCLRVNSRNHDQIQGLWCVYSEYRQAEGSVVSAVAQRLLTTDAPSETTQDLAASAQQLSTTGAAAAAAADAE